MEGERRAQRLAGPAGRHRVSTQTVVVEQRGSHFVALVAEADGRPRPAIVMVGRTSEEAESRLRAWLSAQPAD